MATSLRRDAQPTADREYLLKLLELPLDEFRAALANRSPQERDALTQLWQEENAEAIRSSNEWVEKNGLPLEKHRPF